MTSQQFDFLAALSFGQFIGSIKFIDRENSLNSNWHVDALK